MEIDLLRNTIKQLFYMEGKKNVCDYYKSNSKRI